MAVFDETNKSWQRYDQTHSLILTNLPGDCNFQGIHFLINENTVDYFKPSENRWYNYYLKDVDYIKNIYFRIDTTGFIFPIQRGSENIYIDDGNPANNTANTYVNYSIAGVVGDFDLLHLLLNYVMDDERGVIQFLVPISDVTTIVVSQGMPLEQVI